MSPALISRRSLLALLAVPALAPLLQACGEETDNATPTTEPPSNVDVAAQQSSLTRATTEPEDAAGASQSINEFGLAMYRQLIADDPTVNLVFSPASIAIAVTMAMAGARGATADEMAAALSIDDPAAIHRSMNSLTAQAEAATNPDVTISIANSLWGDSGTTFFSPFLDTLAAEYGAGMNVVSYRTNPEAARAAINAWVDDETEGRIPDLIGPDVFTTDTRLTLVNAVYLKAKWALPFAEELTRPAPFTTASGTSVEVPTMVQQAFFGYAEVDGWRAVDLPYIGDEWALTVMLPDDAGATEAPVDALVGSLGAAEVVVWLPKWDIETSTGLAEQLTSLGMRLAFDDGAADFSGMTEQEQLYVSAVIHQANITVDEEGTEAAAATAVVMAGESAMEPSEPPIEFIVDRPFVFSLRHVATGAIVFLGRIADPSITR